MNRRFGTWAVLLAVALSSAVMLSACGKKGPLEPPPSAEKKDED